MRLASIAVVFAACNAPAPPASMPWLGGFSTSATADVETPLAAERLANAVGIPVDGGYGAIAISTGSGAVLASYAQGIAVVDGSDHVIARAPGFDFEGSADDLVAVAAGDAQLDQPVIVVAITRGGHRESTTSLIVYQPGDAKRLEPLFEAPVEVHDGDQTYAGAVTFVPQGLVYRAPRGALERWRFDSSHHRYLRAETAQPVRE